MKQDSSLPADEARLHALADGRFEPHQAGELRAQLDEAQLRSVQDWQGQRDLLRALHLDVLHEAVPAALTQAAHRVREQHREVDSWRRWGGVAAAVLLSFGAGWLAHGRWDDGAGPGGAAGSLAADFGRQAVFAHVVYSPEVRHPVEVPAAQQEHLVQWLSKRLGRALKVPDLSGQGYELVGGRLLPGEQGARAQFMYQNARAERITLYVGALEPGKEDAASSRETAFHFTSEGGAASFYWVDQGFGYALAGRMERPQLLQLANTVHGQL
jgi:anti-sigma factor RsiW